MPRLFVAFELPESLRHDIDARIATLRSSLPAARWVAAENQHLTLHFVGELEEARVPDLCQSLESVFSCYPPQTLEVRAAGSFPPNSRARVVWLGLEAQASLGARPGTGAGDLDDATRRECYPAFPELARLQGEVSGAVARTAGDAEGNPAGKKGRTRPFTAHVTVARCRDPWPRWAVRKLGSALSDLAGASFVATQGVLFRSQLGGRQARYTRVATFPLLNQ